jgi:hypothetical protein
MQLVPLRFGLDTKRMEDKLPNHVDLIAMLDIADTEVGLYKLNGVDP